MMRRIDELHLDSRSPAAGCCATVAPRRRGDRPGSGRDADAADGDRGDLSQAEHQSKAAPGHKVYPYLLRGLSDRAAEPGVGADISVPQQAA